MLLLYFCILMVIHLKSSRKKCRNLIDSKKYAISRYWRESSLATWNKNFHVPDTTRFRLNSISHYKNEHIRFKSLSSATFKKRMGLIHSSLQILFATASGQYLSNEVQLQQAFKGGSWRWKAHRGSYHWLFQSRAIANRIKAIR